MTRKQKQRMKKVMRRRERIRLAKHYRRLHRKSEFEVAMARASGISNRRMRNHLTSLIAVDWLNAGGRGMFK